MKTFRAFGPTIGKSKLSKKIITILNNHVDKSQFSKKNDYSSKLASQIKSEIKIPKTIVNKNLSKEIIKNIKVYLDKSEVKKIKEIKIINLWVVRQLKNEYNPIHYHEGQLSGVGYLKIPKDMNQNKLVKNKKIKKINIKFLKCGRMFKTPYKLVLFFIVARVRSRISKGIPDLF